MTTVSDPNGAATTAARPRREDWRFGIFSALAARLPRHGVATLWLFVGVVLVYFVTAEYQFLAGINDAQYTAFPAWTLAQNGNLNLDQADVPFPPSVWIFQADGHIRSDRFPGAILLAVPFYWVLGSPTFSLEPAVTSAVVASAVAIVFLHRALLRLVSPTVALGTALMTAFGTTVWTIAADTAWTHAPTLLGLSIGAWGMSRSSYYGAGVGYAIAIISRPHTAVVAAIEGLWVGVSKRSLVTVLKVGATSALGVAGLLLWNRANAGQWTLLPGSYGGRLDAAVTTGPSGQANIDLWQRDLANTFFSPLRGILVYSPFILVLIPGVLKAWRSAPPWVRASSVSAIVYLVVQLSGNVWNGGTGFFGYRISLEMVYLLVPLGALAWVEWVSKKRWRRVLFAWVAGVTVWWFALGAGAFRLLGENGVNPLVWDVGRVIGWAGVSGWIVAALFVAALFYILKRYDQHVQVASPVVDVNGVADVAGSPDDLGAGDGASVGDGSDAGPSKDAPEATESESGFGAEAASTSTPSAP